MRWRGVGTSENDSLEDHRANERDRRNYRAGAEFANRAFEVVTEQASIFAPTFAYERVF